LTYRTFGSVNFRAQLWPERRDAGDEKIEGGPVDPGPE
jgi:hypothetical protein